MFSMCASLSQHCVLLSASLSVQHCVLLSLQLCSDSVYQPDLSVSNLSLFVFYSILLIHCRALPPPPPTLVPLSQFARPLKIIVPGLLLSIALAAFVPKIAGGKLPWLPASPFIAVCFGATKGEEGGEGGEGGKGGASTLYS